MTKKQKQWHYIIGDIHGCFDELLELEAKIYRHASRNKAKALIISVGDLIDRGPKSFQVLKHFMEGQKKGSHIAIQGNHEIMFLQTVSIFSPWNFKSKNNLYPYWLPNYRDEYQSSDSHSEIFSWEEFVTVQSNLWLRQGGYETLESFGCRPENPDNWNIDPEIVNYMINLPFYWENERVIITHALPLNNDLEISMQLFPKVKEEYSDLFNREFIKSSHSLLWNRKIPPKRVHRDKVHISGHTPIETARRLNKIGCIQIDTSCVFGGKLTALCIETNRFLEVEARENYLKAKLQKK